MKRFLIALVIGLTLLIGFPALTNAVPNGSMGYDCSRCHRGMPDQQPPTSVTLSSIAISGPSEINENAAVSLSARATYSDNSSKTIVPAWVENSNFATIGTNGQLSASSVSSNQNVTVTATYREGTIIRTASKTLTILDVVVDPPPVNQPPMANAGPDQTVDYGETVVLNGSGSRDEDGGIASYQWRQISGPGVTLSSLSEESPYFAAPSGGPTGNSLTFELTVIDTGGLRATDTCIVNVRPSQGGDNQAPAANAGIGQVVYGGEQVVLDGSKSSDLEGSIVRYQWKQINGQPVRLYTEGAKAYFKAPYVRRPGTYLTFELTVMDEGGLKAKDSCVILVIEEPGDEDDGRDDDHDREGREGRDDHRRRDDRRDGWYAREEDLRGGHDRD